MEDVEQNHGTASNVATVPNQSVVEPVEVLRDGRQDENVKERRDSVQEEEENSTRLEALVVFFLQGRPQVDRENVQSLFNEAPDIFDFVAGQKGLQDYH